MKPDVKSRECRSLIELGRQLDRQVGGLGALQDAVDVGGGTPE
jgi:hypothetical protein